MRSFLHRAPVHAVAIGILLLAGCVTDAPYAPPPVTDPTTLFWSLTLNHRAITLSTVAPYDTIQLIATPRTVKGRTLTGLPAPTFTSLDLQHVQVSATGLVHAIGVTTQAAVVASLSNGNDTQVDTAMIDVTDTTSPPVLATFTIHPAAGDSAKNAADQPLTVTARAYDPAGNPITGLSVYYATSDSTTAWIDRFSGSLIAFHPGHVTLYATATAYGITRADTLPFTIGYPVLLNSNITAQLDSTGKPVNVFVPNRLNIGPGGNVAFSNTTNVPTDVTFDDSSRVAAGNLFCYYPTWCGSGNIAPFSMDSAADVADALRIRSFPSPGTYRFHSKLSGAAGTITVMTY